MRKLDQNNETSPTFYVKFKNDKPRRNKRWQIINVKHKMLPDLGNCCFVITNSSIPFTRRFLLLINLWSLSFKAVLRIHLILMRIRIKVISIKLTEFFLTRQNFQIFCPIFSLILMLKLNETFRNQEIFIISIVQIWGLRVNFFCSFLLIFCPLDPHIFADPDPRSQNLAGPKHWFKGT